VGSQAISLQKLLAASQGNASLLEVLQQMQQASSGQAAVIGTTPASPGAAGQPNPAASTPPQATGVVSLLGAAYIVQLTNPGAQSAVSQVQAAQAAGNASPLTPLVPVTPIYHQIRASTSRSFSVNSNTQAFGGNTGSTQTYWTLTGLGTGTWYFQFRSSYDGVNFNVWKNADGGTSISGILNEVTEENAGNSNWALFTLPGNLVVGIGTGQITDGEVFDLAEQVVSSGMLAVAGSNGYTPVGNSAYGIINCDVDLQVPSPIPPSSGIPDYPVAIAMRYGQAGEAPKYWPGSASVFAIAFDPTNENVTLYEDPAGTAVWAVMKLPGGAQIAIGQGKNYDGDTIWAPPPAWFNFSRMMSVCSLTDAVDLGYIPHGIEANAITSGVLAAQYNDETRTWSTTANWLAIAWQQGTDVQTVGGFPFLQIQLQGGHAVVIGAGRAPAGDGIVIPAGYSPDKMLTLCTPASFVTGLGHYLEGINLCAFNGALPTLNYEDADHNLWTGDTNWLVAAWK
jgi:hypothetical protein